MRYVCKGTSPNFFENEKASLNEDPAWDNLHCKKQLRLHLIDEQNNLCIYCEREINEKNSHIEHLLAQSDKPILRFSYENLVASCNGDQCEPQAKEAFKPEDVHSCGHKKSDQLDEVQFLNPVQLQDIADYFIYDKETCALCSSEKDRAKASYMIQLLNLDNPRLNNERANARIALERVVKQQPNPKETIRRFLGKERAFISFLRFYYAPFIGNSL